MGLMDFVKGQLLEVIEWTDDSRDTLSFPIRTMTGDQTGRS
jgi:membrane protease subunit (stomatin/prohibitin family)